MRRRKSGAIPKTGKKAAARGEDMAERAVLMVGVGRIRPGEHSTLMGGKEACQVGGKIGVICKRVHFYFGLDLVIESRRHMVALCK